MSARAGTGVVLAKLPHGGMCHADADWSAPTAIGIGGLGGGFNAGAEMVDFLIVLNSRAAVRTFMSSGSLQLGGNLGLAIGPLGRSGEASAAMNAEMQMSAMFSYSMSRGLYGGVTIEGTVLLDRPDANRRVYGETLSAEQILSGHVDPPQFAMPLVGRLEDITGGTAYGPDSEPTWSDSASDLHAPVGGAAAYAPKRGATTRRAAPRPPRSREPMDDLDAQLQSTGLDAPDSDSSDEPVHAPRRAPPASRAPGRSGFSAYAPGAGRDAVGSAPGAGRDAVGGTPGYAPYRSRRARPPPTLDDEPSAGTAPADDDPFADPVPKSDAAPARDTSASVPYAPYKPRTRRPRPQLVDVDDELEDELEPRAAEPARPAAASSGTAAYVPPELLDGDLVVALHDFEAQESSDLSFKRGDIIRVLRRTDNESDWWTGELAAAFGGEKPESGLYVWC